MLEYDELTDFLYDAPSSARFTMPETPFQSVTQHMIDCQIGSGKRFFGFARLRRVGVLGNSIIY